MNKQSPIRILHVVGAMNRAGTETMLMNIYRNLDRSKIQFDFISYSNKEADYDNEIKKMGGRIFRLSKTSSIKQIYKIIKDKGPYTAVHSHTLFHCGIANTAALLAGVKVRIAHAHTTQDNSDRIIRRAYIFFMKKLIKLTSTNLLACSREAGKYLFGEKGIENKNYSYFPNVIDFAPFLLDYQQEVNLFRREANLKEDIVIGHIGRFIEPKNHLFLLKMMKYIREKKPNIKLLLVGDGNLRGNIEEKAKKEGIYDCIRFVGVRRDIPMLLQSMDVFVFPSIYEGLGLVLLEAQASGVPCIVSEAIQPEADLESGLMTQLTLDKGPKFWADYLINFIDKKETNKTLISERLKPLEYGLNLGISKLLNIYEIEVNNNHESGSIKIGNF